MGEDKYYDWTHMRKLDVLKDGCNYDNWENNCCEYSFAVHPKGFLIFLSASELKSCDEYEALDPYLVKENLDKQFQQNRIQCTIELINSVVENKEDKLNILDLGCGQGHITSIIRKCYPSFEISALDYSISAINYAVEQYNGIDYVVGDAYNPPYAKEYFDIIICNNIWEHVPDPLTLLSKMRRILKPGGYVIISTPNRYRISNMVRAAIGKKITLVSESHVTEYSIGQVIEQLAYSEFEVSKVHCKKIIDENNKIKAVIVNQLIYPLINYMLKITKSHHRLDSTIFYLAKKK